MNCIDIRESLSEYIDGGLSGARNTEIEEHLERCDECRREYDDLSKITMLLREIPDVPLPETFDENLRAAIRREKVIKITAVKRRWKMLSSVAAVFVIGIFSITMYNQIDMSAPDEIGAEAVMLEDIADRSLAISNAENSAFDSDEVGDIEYSFNEDMSILGQAARHEVNIISRRSMLDENAKTEIDYYMILLGEQLEAFEFQVIDFLRDEDGVWSILVEIYTVDEYHQSYTETHTYLGQDGKLWIEELSSSTETAF